MSETIIKSDKINDNIKPKKEQGKWMLLIAMSLVGFVMFLDTTMMNVAISNIVADLNTSISTVQSAISLYALVMAAFMITGSKIGEMFGLKKVFIAAMIMYAIGTTAAALAPTISVLVVGWSIVEGLGVAMLLPITTILITINYKGVDRAKALSIFAAVGSAAGALGPIYGGAMTSFLSWRWAFASELIVVLAIFSMLKYVHAPKPTKTDDQKLDVKGSLLMASSLTLILVSVMGMSTYGIWSPKEILTIAGYSITPFGLSIIPFTLGLGFFLLGWFAKWEYKLVKENKEPLINIDVFKNKKFNASVTVGGILAFIVTGLLFVIPVFLQTAFGYSAIETGVALLPMTLSLMIFALIFAPLGSKFSPRSLVQLGLGITAIGTIILNRSLSMELVTSDLVPGLLIFGAGIGIITSQITNLAMSSVTKNFTTEASGVNNTLRQFGTALGTAILGTVLLSGFILVIEKNVNESSVLSADQKEQIIIAVDENVQAVEGSVQPSMNNITEAEKNEIMTIVNDSTLGAMTLTLYTVVFFLLISLFISRKLPKEKFVE
jgi:MFS family permease